LGLLFTLWGNATLFDAVAVSGTASMFLDPILIIGLIVGRTINIWAYLVAFFTAVMSTLAYFDRAWTWLEFILLEGHFYEQLLIICIGVLAIGFKAVLAGSQRA